VAVLLHRKNVVSLLPRDLLSSGLLTAHGVDCHYRPLNSRARSSWGIAVISLDLSSTLRWAAHVVDVGQAETRCTMALPSAWRVPLNALPSMVTTSPHRQPGNRRHPFRFCFGLRERTEGVHPAKFAERLVEKSLRGSVELVSLHILKAEEQDDELTSNCTTRDGSSKTQRYEK